MSRFFVILLLCVALAGLVLAWGQWQVKADVEEEHQLALEHALEEAGFGSLEVELRDFEVTLRGEVETTWQVSKVRQIVEDIRPLRVREEGEQIWMKARLKPMFESGKVRFVNSQLREEQLRALRSWALSHRPGLEAGVRWEEIATDERVVGELGLPKQLGVEPVEGTLAAQLWQYLQEPAMIWAVRNQEDGFTVLAQWPQEDWSPIFEQAMDALPAQTRPLWEWQETQRGVRWGAHIKRQAFAQPEAKEICAFVAMLLGDSRVHAAMWKGGNGGGFEILARERMTGEEVSALRREAARLSGLRGQRALKIGGIGAAAEP